MKVRDLEADRDRDHQLCVFYCVDVLREESEGSEGALTLKKYCFCTGTLNKIRK